MKGRTGIAEKGAAEGSRAKSEVVRSTLTRAVPIDWNYDALNHQIIK